MGYIIKITEPIRIDVPASARDLCVLRTRRMLSLRTFFRIMRSLGLTYTRALLVQGGVERKSYTIAKTEGIELPADVADDKLFTTVYSFVWYGRIDYDEKGHELFIEFTVSGTIEVHDFMMFSKSDLMNAVDNFLTEETMNFMNSFFTEYDFPMVTGFEEFKEVDEDIKGMDEMLSHSVDYCSVHMRRSTTAPYVYRGDLTDAYETYAERALVSVIEWILDAEREFLRKEMEELRMEVEKLVRTSIIDRYRTLAKYARNIEELKKVEATLEKERAKGYITEEEYMEIIKLLKERARELFSRVATAWIRKLEECKTEECVQRRMEEIKSTEIWKNPLFEEYRSLILEKEREVLNRIYSEAVKRKVMPVEAVYRRVYSYFYNRIREEDTVKGLESIKRRIERSVIPDYMKSDLISMADSKIEPIVKRRYESAKNYITACNKISDLIEYKTILKANRSEYGVYYNELMELINSKLRELRKVEKEELMSEIINEYTREGVKFLIEIQSEIEQLPPVTKRELFRRLIRLAKTEEEVRAIAEIFRVAGLSRSIIEAEVSKKLGKIAEAEKVKIEVKEEKPYIETFLERYRELMPEDRTAVIESECYRIISLTEDEQYTIFAELVEMAETVDELKAVNECISKSPYISSPRFGDLVVDLMIKIREFLRRGRR